MRKLLLLTPLLLALISCGADKKEDKKDSPEQKDVKAIQESALNNCLEQQKQKYTGYQEFEIKEQKVHPIGEVKLAFEDPEMEKKTAFVSRIQVTTKDSLHYCNCYHDQKGKVIGGYTNAKNTAPQPTGFAADFENFKTAVLNKDKAALQAMIKDTLGPGVTPEDVLENISYMDQTAVKKELAETKYEDLLDTKVSGTAIKDFTLQEELTTDEEGNEMGMALNFYFLETKDGLKLIYMITPG